jgi:hypothetical protein
VARGIDVSKNLPDVLKAAHAHRGAAFVEIFQNCIVYNDDVFAPFTAPKENATKQLWLKAGEPMLFDGGTKGITLDRDAGAKGGRSGRRRLGNGRRDRPRTEEQGGRPHADRDAVRHLPHGAWCHLRRSAPTFESAVRDQNSAASAGKTPDLQALVSKGQSWQVTKETSRGGSILSQPIGASPPEEASPRACSREASLVVLASCWTGWTMRFATAVSTPLSQTVRTAFSEGAERAQCRWSTSTTGGRWYG